MSKSVSYAQWSLEPYCIGMKLRSLRTQKRLTLARLAGETGLSTALLSKLETDRMVPTLGTLATISRVYGVGLSHFFNEPTRHTISITRKAHLQGHDRGTDQARATPLNAATSGAPLSSTTPGSASPRLSAQMFELPAGGAASISNLFYQSSGLVYVLDGKLQLDSGGLQEVLDTGDCAYIETNMALAWSAAGKQRCRLLAVSPGLAAAQG